MDQNLELPTLMAGILPTLLCALSTVLHGIADTKSQITMLAWKLARERIWGSSEGKYILFERRWYEEQLLFLKIWYIYMSYNRRK